MSEAFISEIRMMSFNFPPKGWALCNGQLLPINQNQALFSLLGTTYGGDGRITFALPNLQGRTAVHFGDGISLPSITLGESAGEETHTLTVAEMAGHTHVVQGNSSPANVATPVGNVWAQQGANPFSNSQANASMGQSAVAPVGGSQAHPNVQPYLVVNFVICLVGIFPSRN